MEKTDWILPPGLVNDAEIFEALYKANFKGSQTKKPPLMIRGDRGVGKTLFTMIFEKFYRQDNRDIEVKRVNIASIPEDLIESFLFGARKGAYTGSVEDVRGWFDIQKDALLILEEIGDLSLNLQAKLLTFIEDHRYYRLGDPKEKSIDKQIQIIGTTNKGNEAFRNDFLDRFIPFRASPVYERRGDILYYLNLKFSDILALLLPFQLLTLLAYNWPGNVREIERVGYKVKTLNAIPGMKDPKGIDIFDFEGSDILLNVFETVRLYNKLKEAGVDVEYLEKGLNKSKFSLKLGGKPVFKDIQSGHKTKYKSEFEKWVNDIKEQMSKDLSNRFGVNCFTVNAFDLVFYQFKNFYCQTFYQDVKANKNLLKIEEFDPDITYERIFNSKLTDKKLIKLDKQICNYIYGNQEPKKDLTQKEVLRQYCEGLLKRTNGNIAEAARRAGLNDKTFRSQLKRLRINT